MLTDLLKQPLPFCLPLEHTGINVTMLGYSPWDYIGSFLFTMPHHSTFFADIPCSASLAYSVLFLNCVMFGGILALVQKSITPLSFTWDGFTVTQIHSVDVYSLIFYLVGNKAG